MNHPAVTDFAYFQKMYQSISALIRSFNYINVDNRDAVFSLLNLARKMEVSGYIHQKNMIAVAGMQGTGKTTLISTLYDLPQDILPMNSERGERNPIFIIERSDLKPGEYKANEVSFDNFKKIEKEIEPQKISEKSRKKNNVAYIELFVPQRYFACENAGFVLLPGFEKSDRHQFDQDYNSVMEYALHFSNAVILTTDGSGIANEDIEILIQKLGQNFSSSNCIFAITKSDILTDDEEMQEQKESLIESCSANGIHITAEQIVSTGCYPTPEQNAPWIETLAQALNTDGLLNYDSTHRSFQYYRPMVKEMIACVNELKDALDLDEISNDAVSPIYDDLYKALDVAKKKIGNRLNEFSLSAQEQAAKKFASINIPDKYLSTKKFLFLHKNHQELASDKKYIAERCQECITEKIGNQEVPLLICEARKKIGGNDGKKKLLESADAMLTVSSDAPFSQEELDNYIGYYLNPTVKALAKPENAPDSRFIATAMADTLCATFYAALTGNTKVDDVTFRTAGVEDVLKEAIKKGAPGGKFAATMAILDMFDGKSDILEAIAGLFTAEAGAASTILGIASIGVIVAMAAKKGVDIYNARVEEQKLILSAWEYSMKNAIAEQCNHFIDIFEDGAKNMLEYVNEIHRTRMHIGSSQMRIIEARYALADIRHLVDLINDEYADQLMPGSGE